MNDLYKYLYLSKLQELTNELQSQGYDVSREVHIDNVTFDLVAKKEDETIIYEVKVRNTLAEEKEQLNLLRKTAIEKGFDFRLVIVVPPHHIDVYIEDLEEQILEYIINEGIPCELDELSSRTCPDGICDLEYDTIKIDSDRIFLKGSGTIEVQLEYAGGEEKDGLTMYDSYPFDFDVELNHKMKIDSLEIKVDTISFYQ